MIIGDTSTGLFYPQIKVLLKDKKNFIEKNFCAKNYVANDYKKRFIQDNEAKIEYSYLDPRKTSKPSWKKKHLAFIDIKRPLIEKHSNAMDLTGGQVYNLYLSYVIADPAADKADEKSPGVRKVWTTLNWPSSEFAVQKMTLPKLSDRFEEQ